MMMRRLASAILRTALRYASPQAQEWGQAMLREMDFVEGDWAALRWSVGSAASLFRRFEVPLSAPGGVLERTHVLGRTIDRRTIVGGFICVIVLAGFVWNAIHHVNTLQLVACGLIIVASVYMLGQIYLRRRGTPPVNGTPGECMDYYREELVRQRDYHRGAWLWTRLVLLFPSCFLFFYATPLPPYPAGLSIKYVVMASFVFMAIPSASANLKQARNYQGQIDELDELRKDLR
jgi:hypothetical protein